MERGTGEHAFQAYKRIGLAMKVTGAHNGNRSFGKVSYVAGPRYTMGLHRSRAFVEALFGFDSALPVVSDTLKDCCVN